MNPGNYTEEQIDIAFGVLSGRVVPERDLRYFGEAQKLHRNLVSGMDGGRGNVSPAEHCSKAEEIVRTVLGVPRGKPWDKRGPPESKDTVQLEMRIGSAIEDLEFGGGATLYLIRPLAHAGGVDRVPYRCSCIYEMLSAEELYQLVVCGNTLLIHKRRFDAYCTPA